MKRKNIKYLLGFILLQWMSLTYGQDYFNAWLTTCSHLVGPTGNVHSLELAIDQSRGLHSNAPGFDWDILIDVGDWTASQEPPGHEEGEHLAKLLNTTLGKDRGRFFTVSGNHDGDAKGWKAGEFTRKYVNPLGVAEFSQTSNFDHSQRPQEKDYRQLLDYPGSRWDRYLIRTGNVIWIMLGDRNEYDQLAESRGDTAGTFQAGRGSDAGMPNGGYPSGAVTLDTFEWWKRVVEDPVFSDDILITTHHLMLANTTITTEDGEPGKYHGKSGSLGPNGEIGGQLYWIREYNEKGKEVNQYAQTRPFLDYLQDHPGAIAAWVGGHSHIDTPESMINGRGIHVRKYGVSFISIGALTDSHAGGKNQMSRMLTFEDGQDEAVINVYIHNTNDSHSLGWYEPAARKVPLGKKFTCPNASTNEAPLYKISQLKNVPAAPTDTQNPRYYWNLNQAKTYDFNNKTHVVGEDGSPYGVYSGMKEVVYSGDTPFKGGRSLDLRNTEGYVRFCAPYTPEMNWENLTLSMWIKTGSSTPQEVMSYDAPEGPGKFRLWYDGNHWIWAVGEGRKWRKAKWESAMVNAGEEWFHFVAIADGKEGKIRLFVNNKLVAEEKWRGRSLNAVPNSSLVLGNSIPEPRNNNTDMGDKTFNGLIDEILIFDRVVDPASIYPEKYKSK